MDVSEKKTLFQRTPFPKGPFRTQNAMALETVVFCYCRSVLLSMQEFAAIFPKKNSSFRPFTVVNHYDHSDLLSP